MISAYAGHHQSASLSLLQSGSENGGPPKSPPPGPRNVLGAVQAHTDGARQAFDQASSQILTAFLDGLQNKISDEPNKGANDAGSLTSLTSAEFESTLSVSADRSNGNGSFASFDLEAFAGLSFDMEQVDGKLTSFNLEFEMATSFSFEGANGRGGSQALSYSNAQSFSISFSTSEDENGNIISELSFERSEVTQASFMSIGDQRGLGFGQGAGSLNDIAAFMDGNGPYGSFEQNGESPLLTADSTLDLEMQAALEIMKSITEDAYDEATASLFGQTYYDDY